MKRNNFLRKAFFQIYIRKFYILFFILIIAFPLLWPILNLSPEYYGYLFTEILIFGIFAMSLDLLMGFTGMISLGHAAFFGLGGYTLGLFSLHFSNNLFFALPLAILISICAGVIIGFLSIRTTGVFFIMITLAFSQMLYVIAFKWMSLTGGDDGLSSIPSPALQLFDSIIIDFSNVSNFYYLVLFFFLLTYFCLHVLINSPTGRIFIGIRENEHRMAFVGFNVKGYKLLSFVISSLFAGIAGSLHVGLNGFISPGAFFWTSSGNVLLMVIIGGVGTLVGPIIGALFFIVSKNYISSYTEHWMLLIGAIFIIIVMFAEKGFMGFIRKRPF